MIEANYTSLNTFPKKLLFKGVTDRIGRIVPYTVILKPTNRCNLKCSYCLYQNENHSDELSKEEILKVIDEMSMCGTRSVVLSGGGEPLMHPDIEVIVEALTDANILIGLVTNGFFIGDHNDDFWNRIEWCRISNDDTRIWNEAYIDGLCDAVRVAPYVDWSFAHNISKEPNYDVISSLILFAAEHNFSHVRFSTIIGDEIDDVATMKSIEDNIVAIATSYDYEDCIIFEWRLTEGHGATDCRMGLLKPVIGADGFIYPCCAVPYSEEEPALRNTKKFSLGSIRDFIRIHQKQAIFNGSNCVRCPYDEYNRVLKILKGGVLHADFV
jgi:radical SAM protein with 4Fe4S-binding SPASM domain